MRLLGLEIVGKNIPSRRDANPFDDSWWDTVEVAAKSGAGVTVSPTNAMQVAAVNAAVRVIAETISSLPLILYRKDKNNNKTRATDHPLYKVIHDLPNFWMTHFEWCEWMSRNLLLRGNAYSQIVIKGNKIQSLNPLHPDCVTPKWKDKESRLVYEYRTNNKTIEFQQWEVLHWKGPSDDGVHGKGPIQEAREVLGNAIALDTYQNFFYQNGVRLSGILEHPGELTDETSDRIAKSFRNAYAGAANSGKVAVIEEGMKFSPISMTLRDAEFIESRKFSVGEIARIFRVPPHMIGDLSGATYSNIESEFISFVVHTIRPWTVRIEQAMMKALLGEEESDLYIEFLLDGLLRGDIKSRYEAYQIGLQNGFLKLNDVREKENMNSLDWGDMSMIPLNMQPIRKEEDLDRIPAPKENNPAPKDQPTDSVNDNNDTSDDQQKKSKSSFSEARLKQIDAAFRPLFKRAFAAIAKREISILERERDQRSKALLSGIPGHYGFIRSQLDLLSSSYLVSVGNELISSGVKVRSLTEEALDSFNCPDEAQALRYLGSIGNDVPIFDSLSEDQVSDIIEELRRDQRDQCVDAFMQSLVKFILQVEE